MRGAARVEREEGLVQRRRRVALVPRGRGPQRGGKVRGAKVGALVPCGRQGVYIMSAMIA